MIRVSEGAICSFKADAALRPVRTDLNPVSAVSRDLGAAAGPSVEDRLQQSGALPLGGAVLTPGGELLFDYLIHVVVMSEEEPQTAATVQRALRNGLRRAADWGLESLVLPPLGIGVGLTEPEVQARALVEILANHLGEGQPPLDLTIAVSSRYEAELFSRLIEEAGGDQTGK